MKRSLSPLLLLITRGSGGWFGVGTRGSGGWLEFGAGGLGGWFGVGPGGTMIVT